MKKPIILISNDDGIDAAGLQALMSSMEPLGEVWVVCPDRERSATSHSMSLHAPLRSRRHADRIYSIDGTPTDCVYLAIHHLLPHPPDLVVSGINHGINLGNDVMYSGTVAAAMEGAMQGHNALALSMDLDADEIHQAKPQHFATAGQVAAQLAQSLLTMSQPLGRVLNVNVPAGLQLDTSHPMKLCRLGFSEWSYSVMERDDPRGRPYFWIGGQRHGHDNLPDSDNQALKSGYVSVTPIHFDVTDRQSFAAVRQLGSTGFHWIPDQLSSTAADPEKPCLAAGLGQGATHDSARDT